MWKHSHAWAVKQFASIINSVKTKNFQTDGWNSHFSVSCVGTAGTCCTSFNVLNYVFLPFNWGMLYRRQKWNFLMGISLIYKTRGEKGCNRYKDECPVVHTEKGIEGSGLLLCSLPNWGSVGAEERIRVMWIRGESWSRNSWAGCGAWTGMPPSSERRGVARFFNNACLLDSSG